MPTPQQCPGEVITGTELTHPGKTWHQAPYHVEQSQSLEMSKLTAQQWLFSPLLPHLGYFKQFCSFKNISIKFYLYSGACMYEYMSWCTWSHQSIIHRSQSSLSTMWGLSNSGCRSGLVASYLTVPDISPAQVTFLFLVLQQFTTVLVHITEYLYKSLLIFITCYIIYAGKVIYYFSMLKILCISFH